MAALEGMAGEMASEITYLVNYGARPAAPGQGGGEGEGGGGPPTQTYRL